MLVVGALICLLPLVLDTYYLHIAILVLIWAFLACAWNILGGYGGQHSLGNGLFMGIGAYGVAYLVNRFDLTPWVGLLVAIVACGGTAAAFIGWVVFRYALEGRLLRPRDDRHHRGRRLRRQQLDRPRRRRRPSDGVSRATTSPCMQFAGKNGYFYVGVLLLVFDPAAHAVVQAAGASATSSSRCARTKMPPRRSASTP